jgi:hypothetical protein
MSFAQALDGQIDLLTYYTRGAGLRQCRGLYDLSNSEGRMGAADGSEYTFEEYLKTVLVGLDGGASVYWSPEMSGLLEGVAPGMPSWTLRPEAIPDRRCFLWFAKPLAMPSWQTAGSRNLRAIGITALDRLAIIAFWMQEPDASRPFPAAAMAWEYGTVWQGLVDKPRSMGLDVQNDDRHERLGQYLAAALALMEQRIIVSQPERPPRSTRKRAAEVWSHEPTIRVIQLRRAVNPNEHREPGSEPIEWSCSWVVRGHWRQQACGEGRLERRPVFVLPYLKGDLEKPLKAPADRVFAVTR